MQVCTCGKETREGALFCEHCGKLLAKSQAVELVGLTTVIKQPQSDIATGELRESAVFPKDGTLVIVIGEETLRLSVEKQFILGRHIPDGEEDAMVIDLSPYNALERGVSRRHAGIHRASNNSLQIVDLDSANGTFINGLQIPPRQFFHLHHGDKINLSRLAMLIRYETVDEQPQPAQ